MQTLPDLTSAITRFRSGHQLGPDPLAALYPERRRAWSLFTPQLSDGEIESLRAYLFAYDTLPLAPSDPPVLARNYIAGEWRAAAAPERATPPRPPPRPRPTPAGPRPPPHPPTRPS